MHDVYFSHRSHHTASPSDLWEATHASSIFFPQIPSYHITIWPPGGHSCIMYIFPTDPIIPHHHLASRRPLMHHVYFPTGLITLHHHLASRRPLMHYVYFSHRFHHTTSPTGLQEATHASYIFFSQVRLYHITNWPPGGHSCIMYIFPTGLITLHHHLASRRPLMHHVYFPTGLITLRHHLASRGPLMHHVYFSHRSHHTASPSDLWEGTHA